MRLTRRSYLPLMFALAACSQPADKSAAQTPPLSPEMPLAAPNRAPPSNFATMKMSFAPIVKRAAPAVVNVYSTRTVRTQVDPFWGLFGGLSVPRERVEGSLGSGVIVRADGVIVTNNHVVEGGQQLRVVLADRREFPAKVLLADPRSDLAVLKIDVKAERLPVLPIENRNDVEVGDLVLAIGDPFGVGQTVTNGIISGLARTDVGASDSGFYLQTDAAINPGNSGGPLVDINGNLIGLNTFILSRSGSSSGVGFAIPAALVRRVVESAAGGVHTVQRPWLGVRVTGVNAESARSLGLEKPEGVLIAEVYPGGAAARAGLQVGDLLLSVDGQSVSDQASVNYVISTHRPGETVTLQIRRSGAPRSLSVVVSTPPADPPRDERTLTGRNPFQGVTVVNLSPATADQYGLDPFLTGVLITEAGQGFGARAGFQGGDIVRSINGHQVQTTADLASALGGAQSWRIVIQRGEQQIVAEF
ncbi:MAG: Do family serine endopeptidase [Caulobacteraceae bacterium]